MQRLPIQAAFHVKEEAVSGSGRMVVRPKAASVCPVARADDIGVAGKDQSRCGATFVVKASALRFNTSTFSVGLLEADSR